MFIFSKMFGINKYSCIFASKELGNINELKRIIMKPFFLSEDQDKMEKLIVNSLSDTFLSPSYRHDSIENIVYSKPQIQEGWFSSYVHGAGVAGSQPYYSSFQNSFYKPMFIN